MHDSFTPLGGLVPMFNIMTGEVIFGGVGAGLYGILLYCILAVFIAGLMVGRTPEYIGKKIEQKEVKMAMLAVIATAFSILVFSALSSVLTFQAKGYWNPQGAATANVANNGPHGLSEILYTFVSSTGNNGSAFNGIAANTPWYDLTTGLAMWIGWFLFLIPLLAAAGSLAAKKKIRPQHDSTSLLRKKLVRARPLFDPDIVRRATAASFVKLNPVILMKNPVMFVVEVGAAITTVLLIRGSIYGRFRHRIPNPDFTVALVHGAVRELRGNHGCGNRVGQPP
jgi:hypothetical protein